MRQRSKTTEAGENARGMRQERCVRKCARVHLTVDVNARTVTIVAVSLASKTLVVAHATRLFVSTASANGTSADSMKNSTFTLYSNVFSSVFTLI